MIDVSVVIPVYNAEKHLEQCLLSVCGQTLQNIEIICVDDGSDDGSAAILAAFAGRDARIITIRQENAGAGVARNYGIAHAQGKYLSFLDADDFFEPDMLEKAFEKAEHEQAEIVVFGADFFNEKLGTFLPCYYNLNETLLPAHRPFAGVDVPKDIFKTVVGWAWDKLFLASFVRENKLFFQQQRTSNDLLFVFAAMVRAKRIATVSQVLAHQRRSAGETLSVSREKSWDCFYHALSALRSQLKDWQLYDRFEQDYINYALHFSLWNLNTLRDPAREKLYNRLRETWFAELGITDYPREKFYHKGEYERFVKIMRRPYNPKTEKIAGFLQRVRTGIRRAISSVL